MLLTPRTLVGRVGCQVFWKVSGETGFSWHKTDGQTGKGFRCGQSTPTDMGPLIEPHNRAPAGGADRVQQRTVLRDRRHYHELSPAERLDLDRERVDRFRLGVSAIDDFGVFETEILPDVWDYANRTLPALIMKGEVFHIRSRAGGPHYQDLVVPPGGIDPDTAQDLAASTIEKAVPGLRDSILEKWDGYRDDTARLGTWFVTLCSFYFVGQFRRWRRDTARLTYIGLDLDARVGATTAWEQPEAVIFDVEFERHLDLIGDPVDVNIVRLDDIDLTDSEIAEVLDLTAKKVEYRLKKFRRTAQARWDFEKAADNLREQVSVIA